MNEYIKGCYKLKPGIYGDVVRNECLITPAPNIGDILACGVAGTGRDALNANNGPPVVSEIIDVSVTKAVNGPEVDAYVVTWKHKDGSIKTTEGINNWFTAGTTLSLYIVDGSEACEKNTSDPNPEPGCTMFDPSQYQYVRFVGKGTATGLDPIHDLTDKSEIFYGYYIDDNGNIETPWTVLDEGGSRTVGGLWNYQLVAGGGSPRLYDATTNTTNGYDEWDFGGIRKTIWTPAVNFYDHIDEDIPGGPQIGTGNGVPWRANVTATTNGLKGGYGSSLAAIGDLGVNGGLPNPLQTFTSQPAFSVRAQASLRNTGTDSGLYPEVGDSITLTIEGHWEFSNDQVTVEATWLGTNDAGDDLECLPEISPGCPSLPYNPTWLSNPCPKLSVPIGVELNCPELAGPPEPGVLPPSTTNDTRWCVAVIDEDDSQGFNTNTAQWTLLRANYPHRIHFVLEASRQDDGINCSNRSIVYSGKTTVNGQTSTLNVPDNYKEELDTIYANWIPVNRDFGGSCADDWYTLIGAEVLPANAKLALFIDNSGSMTTSTVRASYDLFVSKLSARNIDFFVVENTSENWINTFNSDFV